VRGDLARLKAAGARGGKQATHVVRLALYGTRRVPTSNAGDGPEQTPAMGLAKRSVWQGPKKTYGGAPILRRNRPA
jgi:hypothetical protein